MAHSELFASSGAHRLIPAKYSDAASVLETLPLPLEILEDLSELDAATNERKIAEDGANPSIGPGELLFGVPEAHIVNAAFCHPGTGGRFHDSQRGAWYAGVELETSFAEVAYHKRRFLSEARITDILTFEYQDFIADFAGAFSYLDQEETRTCLLPEPVPQCYGSSQALAEMLLYAGSNGIIYPSVRNNGGTCIACFRPALVFHPRRGKQYNLTLGTSEQWKVA